MIFGYLKKKFGGNDDSDQRKSSEMKYNIIKITPRYKQRKINSVDKEPESALRKMSDNTLHYGNNTEIQSNSVCNLDELVNRMDTLENKITLILDKL